MDTEIQQLRRSSAFANAADAANASIQALVVQTIQQGESRLRTLYSRLLKAADVLPLSAIVFGAVEGYRARFQDLTLSDAIVLTSVLTDPQLGTMPACFLNRDTAFDDPAIHDELGLHECKLLGSFVDGLGYIKSKMK